MMTFPNSIAWLAIFIASQMRGTGGEGLGIAYEATDQVLCELSDEKQSEKESGAYVQPNIVFILADDLGFNDVGYHQKNPKNPIARETPNIDSLSAKGVRLEQYYVQPVCTPSRAALMTGMYPYHIGRQNEVLLLTTPTGVTVTKQFLSNGLKTLGYDTHLVGKWHLGNCNDTYLPTNRGFDTQYGYWEGMESFYTKDIAGVTDFKENDENIPNDGSTDVYTTYASFLYNDRVNTILDAKTPDSKPFFLFLATQLVHTPIDVPDYWNDQVADVHGIAGYPAETTPFLNAYYTYDMKYRAMIHLLDSIVGNVTAKLEQKELLDNTVIVFSSDNGGLAAIGDSNYPLRGAKHEIYEGGTRVPGFIHFPLLTKKNYTHQGLTHMTDWFPTLLRVAGANADCVGDLGLDGFDQYETFFGPEALRQPSPRRELIYNIGDHETPLITGAIRKDDVDGSDGNWKYIREVDSNPKNLGGYTEQLYNVKTDPTEGVDLSTKEPIVLATMSSKFDDYAATMVPGDDPASLPYGSNKDADGYIKAGDPGWCVGEWAEITENDAI